MRILITLPWGERLGGAEVMLQTVLDGAQESPHQLELVFLAPGPWANELIDAGFHVEVIDAGRVRQAGRLLACVVQLSRTFRRRQPDLIVNWIAKTQLYCSPAATLAGMGDRVIWWQHDMAAGYWLDRVATAMPAIAVGCSSRTSARAQARLFPHRPTFAVAPGTRMPDGDSPEAPLVLPAGVPVVGLVGRLQPWKGQDRLLQAQALLRQRGERVHTLIVGGDAHRLSPEYAASLQPLASRLGLDEDVTMTGQVSDVGPYVDRMDVLVNASDPEPFGIVLLEAMARGVAVVAVNAGGPPEFIEDQRTGVLARSGEPAALAAALEPLIASPSLRQQLGRAGRERYLRDFTDVAMRRRFFAQMESLAETGRPRGGPV
jgi:glycosyltransferase involved in cell wall biosynthesis